MAIGEFKTDSFDFYEGIRIVVPGAVAAGILEAVLRSIGAQSDLSIRDPLLAVVGAIALGLVLYYLDIPTRSATYRDRQPTDVLEKWYPEKSPRERLQDYFIVLDELFPPLIRARALYNGSIFRIGFESVLLLATAQIGVWFWASMCGCYQSQHNGPRFQLTASILGGLLVSRFLASVFKEVSDASKARGGTEMPLLSLKAIWSGSRTVLRQMRKDFGWVDTAVLVLGVGLLVAGIAWSEVKSPRPVSAAINIGRVGALIVATQWLLHFMWGGRLRRMGSGKPVNPVSSMLLYCVASVGILWLINRIQQVGLVDETATLGWLGGTILTGILLVSRGYDRRLTGIYFTQSRWLERNETQVRQFLDQSQRPSAQSGENSRRSNPASPFQRLLRWFSH